MVSPSSRLVFCSDLTYLLVQVLRVSESGLSANGFLPITAPPTHLVAMVEEQEPRRPGSLPARATTTAQFDRIE